MRYSLACLTLMLLLAPWAGCSETGEDECGRPCETDEDCLYRTCMPIVCFDSCYGCWGDPVSAREMGIQFYCAPYDSETSCVDLICKGSATISESLTASYESPLTLSCP